MENITSQQNSQIKLLKKLSQKKYREQEHKFLVENLIIIYDALRAGYEFESIFVTEDFVNKNQEMFSSLQDDNKTAQFYLIDDKINKHISSLDTPSGIIAIYKIRTQELEQKKSVIYLNGIGDPGNMGAIMRTALAFGIENIVVDEKCVDIYNSKAISSAKDAIFKLRIYEDKERKWLKDKQGTIPVYIADSNKGEKLRKFQGATDYCLVLGSESHGVDDEIANMGNKNIKIEISASMESLNVAQAAAIIIYSLQGLE